MNKSKDLSQEDYDNEGLDNEIDNDGDVEQTARNFLQKRQRTLIIIGIALVAVIGIIFYLKHRSDENNKAASIALSRVMPYYNSGAYEAALKGDPRARVRGEQIIGLAQIADEYSSTDAGKLAALLAGNAYLAGGKADDANRYFDIASKAESEIVEKGAAAGRAAALELKGSWGEAAKLYEEAANFSKENRSKTRYMLYAGLCYERAKDNANAEKAFRAAIDYDETGELATYAKQGLTRLGMKIE
ncbi:MAG: hypothetical protein ACM3U1_11735 [Chloroflexota bacterium]